VIFQNIAGDLNIDRHVENHHNEQDNPVVGKLAFGSGRQLGRPTVMLRINVVITDFGNK
jgi:hypothetical protein